MEKMSCVQQYNRHHYANIYILPKYIEHTALYIIQVKMYMSQAHYMCDLLQFADWSSPFRARPAVLPLLVYGSLFFLAPLEAARLIYNLDDLED